jgi:hypothetical protein
MCVTLEFTQLKLTVSVQKLPKRQRTPSPDRYQLSDSEIPGDGDLDLSVFDEDSAALNQEIFDFCYAEVDKELDGEIELIGEDEANVLYGVSACPGRYELIN